MKNLFFFISLLLTSFESFSQRNGFWIFGDSCALKFSSNSVECALSPISTIGQIATICNNSGSLRFTVTYNGIQQSDIYNVHNKNFDIMENGDSILAYTQILNAINIIPSLKDTNKFFIFHRSYYPRKELYSIVDMSYNNGLGKVIKKNIGLVLNNEPNNYLRERAWIKHANGRDWWLLVHPFLSDEFQAYLFANDTLTFQHRQYIGPYMGTTESPGWMAVSPDGSKIANCTVFGQLYLYDFDRCTGYLSRYTFIHYDISTSFINCVFSNNNVLYITDASNLYQVETNEINPTISLIWNRGDRNGCFAMMQKAPDDKIYIASYALPNQQCFSSNPNRPYMIENTHLSVIEKPDELGLACQFVPYKIPTCNKRTLGSLPNSPHYDLGALAGSGCDTIWPGHNGKENSLYFHLYPNPSQNEVQINCGNCGYEESKNYFMYDAAGRRVLAGTFTGRTLELTLENLQRGVYFLELRYKNEKAIKKKVVKI